METQETVSTKHIIQYQQYCRVLFSLNTIYSLHLKFCESSLKHTYTHKIVSYDKVPRGNLAVLEMILCSNQDEPSGVITIMELATITYCSLSSTHWCASCCVTSLPCCALYQPSCYQLG